MPAPPPAPAACEVASFSRLTCVRNRRNVAESSLRSTPLLSSASAVEEAKGEAEKEQEELFDRDTLGALLKHLKEETVL